MTDNAQMLAYVQPQDKRLARMFLTGYTVKDIAALTGKSEMYVHDVVVGMWFEDLLAFKKQQRQAHHGA